MSTLRNFSTNYFYFFTSKINVTLCWCSLRVSYVRLSGASTFKLSTQSVLLMMNETICPQSPFHSPQSHIFPSDFLEWYLLLINISVSLIALVFYRSVLHLFQILLHSIVLFNENWRMILTTPLILLKCL